MNVTEALESRYTCRAYKAEALSRQTLEEIIKAALHTPSWANSQPWEVFVAAGDVLDSLRESCLERFRSGAAPAPDLARPEKWPPAIDERIHALGAARFESLGIERNDKAARRAMQENNNRFFGAPAVAYLCMDRTLSAWSIHDLGMLAQSIMLAAAERGVASAIAYNLVIYPDLVRAALEIPEELFVIIGIALGYEDAESNQNRFRSQRRSLEDTVRFRGI